MGMFDYVYCYRKLPGPRAPNDLYQTKDLDCAMNTFIITIDGQLCVAYRLYGWSSDQDQKYTCGPRIDFNGELQFYDYAEDKTWCNYRALFRHGWLEELQEIKDD